MIHFYKKRGDGKGTKYPRGRSGPFTYYFNSKLTDGVARFVFVHAEICPTKKAEQQSGACRTGEGAGIGGAHTVHPESHPAHRDVTALLVTGDDEEP